LNSLANFRQIYIRRISQRFNEILGKLFIGKEVPEDTSHLTTFIVEEIEIAMSSTEELAIAVSKVVTEAISYVASRAASLISPDGPLIHLDNVTPAQARNIKVFNLLWNFHSSVTQAFSANSMSIVRKTIDAPLAEVEKAAKLIVGPLFGKVLRQLETTLTDMHKENFSQNEMTAEVQTSQYLKVLQQQVYMFYTQIIPKFQSGEWLQQQTHTLSSRLLTFFVRHASLIRPLGEAGKLRLAADMAQLELSLATLQPLSTLGQHYRALRAFRPFIFKELSTIVENPERDLPPSAVFHQLISRAPATLQLPHELKKMTLMQYSDWMDHHSETQTWALVKECLNQYAAQVNSRGEMEFTPYYPAILNMAEPLLQSWAEKNK